MFPCPYAPSIGPYRRWDRGPVLWLSRQTTTLHSAKITFQRLQVHIVWCSKSRCSNRSKLNSCLYRTSRKMFWRYCNCLTIVKSSCFLSKTYSEFSLNYNSLSKYTYFHEQAGRFYAIGKNQVLRLHAHIVWCSKPRCGNRSKLEQLFLQD